MEDTGDKPSCSVPFKKPRSKGWTEQEEMCLIEEVNAREEALFGEMKGCGAKSILRVKMEGWQAIADVLNGRFTNAKRERLEVRKKFFNLKQRAKSKIDTARVAVKKTGGGPAPPGLTSAEEVLMVNMEGSPGMLGLPSGIDTDDCSNESNKADTIEDGFETVPEKKLCQRGYEKG